MKILLVRRTDTGEYEGRNQYHQWVSKSCPRTFGRWSDFSNHAINYALTNEKYLGVDYMFIEILEIDLEDLHHPKVIPISKYFNRLWNKECRD